MGSHSKEDAWVEQQPAMPKNDMKMWDGVKRSSVAAAALQERDARYQRRQASVETLKAKRLQIIADDAKWEMTAEFKGTASNRMKRLVCPAPYYSHSKCLFAFSGSWDTIDWQHFVER